MHRICTEENSMTLSVLDVAISALSAWFALRTVREAFQFFREDR